MAFYNPSATCQIARLGELYESVFGQRADGTFVEVGAFDGDTYSNTAFLADMGWTGLYVEPVPELAKICRWRHLTNRKVLVAECAVGATPGRMAIQVAGSFSSLDKASIERAKDVFRALPPEDVMIPYDEVFTGQAVDVEVARLDDLMTRYAIPPGFEVLVVDVEGFEVEVFASFDLKQWRPQLVIVELMDMHPQYRDTAPANSALRARILAQGYRHLHVDEVNTVFVRDDDD